MPKEYEQDRDRMIRKGVPTKEAKKRAAIAYNKRHPGHPVTRKKHGR